MDLVALLKKYQAFNPETGEFDEPRTNRDYARLLGVHESSLSRAYDGLQPVNLRMVQGLLQTFPEASDLAAEVLRARRAEPVTS